MAQPPTVPDPVVVLGMHRSGTSVVAGVIGKLFGGLPKTLMSAGFDNPKGFFESESIRRFNDKLLRLYGSSWSDVGHFRAIDPGERVEGLAEAKSIFLGEYNDQKYAVCKDPRLCRLIPFWKNVWSELEVSPKYFLVFRDPSKVSASLARRNAFSRPKASALWLVHNVEAILNVDESVELVKADEAVLSWREGLLPALAKSGLVPGQGARSDLVDKFIEHKLFSQESVDPETPACGLAEQLYFSMQKCHSGQIDFSILQGHAYWMKATFERYFECALLATPNEIAQVEVPGLSQANSDAIGVRSHAGERQSNSKISSSISVEHVTSKSKDSGSEAMKTKVQENGAPQEIESEYSPVEELRRLRTQLLESRFRERKLRNKLAVLAEDNADKASIIANQNARLKDLDGQNQRAISEVAALARSITLLEDERDEAQKELRSLKADLDARRAKLVVSSGEKLGEHVEIRALQDVGAKLLRKREDAVHENVALSELLRVAEQRELRCRKDLSRLQSQWQAYAKWLSIYIPEIYDVGRIRPGSSQLDELQRRVKASKLFDQAWYKQSYPDVGEFAFGAAEHFILHGLFEGRTPTCDIAVVPDVNESEARDAD